MVLPSLMVPRMTMRTAAESATMRMWMTSSASGWALPGAQAAREVQIHSLGQETRAGVEAQNRAPAGSGVAGLLEKFALGGCQIVFTFIDAARRQLPQHLACGMAILAFEQDLGLGATVFNREDHHRTGVVDNIATGVHAAGFEDFVGRDAEGGSVVNLAGRKNRPWRGFLGDDFGMEIL